MFECECSGGENMGIFRLGERGNGQSKKESGNGLYKVSGGKCRRECQLYQGFWKGEVTLKYVEK